MSDKNKGRRKLLKSIASGSGAVVAGKSIPESWSKPIIDSVILPVHAETTDGPEATTTPALSCAECFISTNASSYSIPENSTIGIIPADQITEWFNDSGCTGDSAPWPNSLVLARSKSEAESFLKCTDGLVADEFATNEGSSCSLWGCND